MFVEEMNVEVIKKIIMKGVGFCSTKLEVERYVKFSDDFLNELLNYIEFVFNSLIEECEKVVIFVNIN